MTNDLRVLPFFQPFEDSALHTTNVMLQMSYALRAQLLADAIGQADATARAMDAMKKVADVRRRLAAIEEGDEEALTGVLRLMPALTGCEFMLMGVD